MLIIFSPLITGFSSCRKDVSEIQNDSLGIQNNPSLKFTKHGEVYFLDSVKNFVKKIDVEIADNDDSRHRGLMFREDMSEDQGMLFIFQDEEVQGFYMRNTVLSLDIIFVNASKKIIKIHRNTTPLSEKTLSSVKPAVYVVEVKAGFADKYKIREGCYIEWRRN
jgi:uncharacterized membrane protein (UPF0127 family)